MVASLLMRALICALMAPTIIAASSSGTFEIDLIFPRRGTWAPTDEMPIVFAIQRPDLAPSMAISIISWTLLQRGTSNRQTGDVVMPDFDRSSNKPFLISRTVSNTSGVEDSWAFTWSFSAGNCTPFTDPRISSTADPTSYVYRQHYTTAEFNTSKSASNADWTNLTSAQSCGGADGVAFAISDILKVSPGTKWQGFNASCAVFGPTGTTSNPCAVTIDAAAASSVSASLAYQTCLNEASGNATGKCTPPSSSTRVTASWPLIAILCAIGFAIL